MPSPVPKIEKVRRKLRNILPAWFKEQGRAPTLGEFLEEYRTKDQIHSSEYSGALKAVKKELGLGGSANNSSPAKAKTIGQLNKAADERLNKRLIAAAKHLLPVMEKGRLEEVTLTFDPETGEAAVNFQAAPPPRQQIKIS